MAPRPWTTQQQLRTTLAGELVMGRWRSCVASGLRAALACTIVGMVSLYAPPAVRRHITFPAFSYVVTVIIVTDATVGTALRGAVSAVHATLMGAAPSVLALWLAHRTGAAQSVLATSAVVALTAFAVALPESVGPVAKRIALGQIIIIYVARFQQGERPTHGFALGHPANVVACTALGVAAALLAVLLPWPRLASREARDKATAYRALAAERVRVMVDACATIIITGSGSAAAACSRQQRWQMAACASEAKRLAAASTALLRRMNAVKEDVQWERGSAAAAVEDDIISMLEMPLTGMQLALSTMMMMMIDEDNKLRLIQEEAEHHAVDIVAMRDHIRLALLTATNKHTAVAAAGFCSSKPPRFLCLPLQPQQQLGSFWLFLFSLYQLRAAAEGLLVANNANDVKKKIAPAATPAAQEELSIDEQPSSLEVEAADGQAEKKTANPAAAAMATTKTKAKKLVAAAKCGFSLGLAVLLGLLFSNDHGFWSGLIVATTIATGRDSTWVVAAARAHGTALGSVYAAVGCLLISQQRLLTMDLRFLALLPWMVIATLLKRSRAYGPAGGVAAALSGIIIMGRRYDEPPMAFTVSRLIETFIGIACAIMADIIFQPGARPSVKARKQLTRCIATMLAACCSCSAGDDASGSGPSQPLAINKCLALLRRHAAEAASEPSYLWLPPFPAACYDNIQGSLDRMAQLLHLYHQARMATVDDDYMAIQRRRFSSLVSASLGHCLRMLQAPMSTTTSSPDHPHHQDLEAGTCCCCCCCCKEEEEDHHQATTTTSEEVVGAFLAHAREVLDDGDGGDQAQEAEDGEERALLVCCLGSMGLCMGEIIREAQRLEAHIIDLNNIQPH